MLASQNGHLDVVHLLVQTGAALQSQDSEGRTAFMIASLYGHLDIVRLFLQSGAATDAHKNDVSTSLI